MTNTIDTPDIQTTLCGFREMCGYERINNELHLTVEEKHLNAGRIMHGGMIASLLDHVSSHPIILRQGQVMATVGINVQYLAPARKGHKLVASAILKKQGRDIAFIDAKITNQKGEIIATSDAIYKLITMPKSQNNM